MLFIYIFMILLGAFPLVFIVRKMREAAKIQKEGIHTNGAIKHINTIRIPKGARIDQLTIEYTDRATGKPYYAKATVTHGKYKYSDTIDLAYLPKQPAKYAIDSKGGNAGMLIFSIILFLFVIFAVYKIREMVETGQM